MKFSSASSLVSLGAVVMALATTVLLQQEEVSACTVHVYPRPGVYPQNGYGYRMYSFNGVDWLNAYSYNGAYTMRPNEWNDLRFANTQASCKVGNRESSDAIIANLPCNKYYIQKKFQEFCEARLDPSTGKPLLDPYGIEGPKCKYGERLRRRAVVVASSSSDESNEEELPVGRSN